MGGELYELGGDKTEARCAAGAQFFVRQFRCALRVLETRGHVSRHLLSNVRAG